MFPPPLDPSTALRAAMRHSIFLPFLEYLMTPNETSYAVVGAALKVHSHLGAGVLESTVSECFAYEMVEAGLHVEREVCLPLNYKRLVIPRAYRIDFIVERCLVVEVKCVEKLLPVHVAQVLSYLRLSGQKLGLLINFNVPHLRDGIKRVING
jgi:GxxExxY protein